MRRRRRISRMPLSAAKVSMPEMTPRISKSTLQRGPGPAAERHQIVPRESGSSRWLEGMLSCTARNPEGERTPHAICRSRGTAPSAPLRSCTSYSLFEAHINWAIEARDMSHKERKDMSKPKRALKKIPIFRTEEEEREFWAKADSTDYVDWSKARAVQFPRLQPTSTVIPVRGKSRNR